MAYRNNYDDLLRDIQASGQSWSSYDLELAKENPDAGRSIFTQKQAWANAQTEEERRAANDAAELIRKQYGGYTGGSSGTGFTLDGTYTSSQKAPSYTQYVSKYQSQIDDLMAQISNRPDFSYTPTDDPSYAAYSEHYRNAGDQAREDTLAQAAAMTGGQASSYAVAAAEQAQNAYNAQMSDVIPQLREAAYGRYMDEGNAMRNDLSTLLALDEAAYGRHQNDYANQMAEWQANYGVSRDLIEDKRYESELALAQAAAAAKQTGSGGGGYDPTDDDDDDDGDDDGEGFVPYTSEDQLSPAAKKQLSALAMMYGSMSNRYTDKNGWYPVEKSIMMLLDDGTIDERDAEYMLRHFGYDASKHFDY